MTTLIAYITASVLIWSPYTRHAHDESSEEYATRISKIAEDIVAIAQDEEPAVRSDDASHSKSATLLAVVAFFESNFALWVDRGDCNSADWRSHQSGWLRVSCDTGLAVSLWQIQPAEGIVLLKPSEGDWSRASNFPWQWRHDPANDGRILGSTELLGNRRVAARVALHMLRRSLRGGTLCGYSGETDNGCPKARARLDFARNYWTTHPFRPED